MYNFEFGMSDSLFSDHLFQMNFLSFDGNDIVAHPCVPLQDGTGVHVGVGAEGPGIHCTSTLIPAAEGQSGLVWPWICECWGVTGPI